MSRSVSYPRNAAYVTFATLPGYEDLCDEFQWAVEDFTEELKLKFPSFRDDVVRIGREDKALVSNGLVRAGVSEYCGLLACWLVPKDGQYNPLAANWCAQVSKGFADVVEQVFGARYECTGRASNGEAFYLRVPG